MGLLSIELRFVLALTMAWLVLLAVAFAVMLGIAPALLMVGFGAGRRMLVRRRSVGGSR